MNIRRLMALILVALLGAVLAALRRPKPALVWTVPMKFHGRAGTPG